jgi:hypothetical protein
LKQNQFDHGNHNHNHNIHHHRRFQKVKNFVILYQNLLMIAGLIVSFAGGSWDITYHILSKPESFFSYPHAMVYSGILLVIVAFSLSIKFSTRQIEISKRANKIVFVGITLIILAGPFDFSWHLRFGLDGLLSPPHLSLLTGWLLVAIGNLMKVNRKLNLADPNIFENDCSSNVATKTKTKTTSKTKSKNNSNHPSFFSKNDNQEGKGKHLFFIFLSSIQGSNKYLLTAQLTLNLFILLMIFSGFLYFFSLPFSETKNYNFNPPSMVGLLVYGIGFPFLISFYFQFIYTKYHFFRQAIPLVGIAFVGMTLFTQITSNPHLISVSGLYLLNLIPFLVLYIITAIQSKLILKGKMPEKILESNIYSKLYKLLIVLVIPVLSFTLSFPLNVYIYNEEFYGYLIYQNVVLSVYEQIINDFFVIVIPLSVAGGLLGYIVFKLAVSLKSNKPRKNSKVSSSASNK